ncbi:hypothetical protein [Pseudomaricurvus sp.]|uniref:hypothetical protein n=1 Tax=Pseudomaricurvus sp. TaxID=2004510 RepID=UPI003F6A9D26
MFKQGLLLAPEEMRCYQYAQNLRQRALKRRLGSIKRIVWPRLVRELSWSEVHWRRILQGVCLALVWPLIILGGLIHYLWNLMVFPFLYFQTLSLPKGLKAPGEKTLMGMNNAFQPVLTLNERDYIECLDQWVVILFGADVSKEKSLSIYLSTVAGERRATLGSAEVANSCENGLRSNLFIARQRLSRDLGHYLDAAKSRDCRTVSLESLAS